MTSSEAFWVNQNGIRWMTRRHPDGIWRMIQTMTARRMNRSKAFWKIRNGIQKDEPLRGLRHRSRRHLADDPDDDGQKDDQFQGLLDDLSGINPMIQTASRG